MRKITSWKWREFNSFDRKFRRYQIKWMKIFSILGFLFLFIWILRYDYNLEANAVEIVEIPIETQSWQSLNIKEVSIIPKLITPTLEVNKISFNWNQEIFIKWNNRNYAVRVFEDRVRTMQDLGYSDTRILDLLAIMNMECWSYKWNCFNWNDIWPMQINQIHKEQYNKSWEIYNRQNWGELFKYQLDYANWLVESYEAWNCREEYVIKYWVWDTYNQKRWRCIAFHYNWHPVNKYNYNTLGWERREQIKSLIYNK